MLLLLDYIKIQGFQYCSSVPVLHYLQAVLFLKIWTFCMNILCKKSLKMPKGGNQNLYMEEQTTQWPKETTLEFKTYQLPF
jgi:hypothetical protein